MSDFFARFDEPRRPWLDAEALKAKFLPLSAATHPDRFHTADAAERQRAATRYGELNAAFQCLRDPRSRLLHLLELELGARPPDVQRVPSGAADLFVDVARTGREVDGFLAERRWITSPLLKVKSFEQAMAWTDRLEALRRTVDARRDELVASLRGFNVAWETAPPPGDPSRPSSLPLARLEELYRALSFVARWSTQLQERLRLLALPPEDDA